MRPSTSLRRVAIVLALAVMIPVAGCGESGDPERVDGPGAERDQVRHTIPGTELFRADFETGDLRQWDGSQAVADDRIRVVRDPVDQGQFSGRFEVRDGDNPIGFGDRAEVQLGSGEREGEERWYAWSTMFAPDFPRTDAWQVVTQWHSAEDGPPPVALYVVGDDLELQTNPYDADGQALAPITHWAGPLDRGIWRHLRLHVVWSSDPDEGLLELWVDDERVTPPIRTQTLRPGQQAFLKQGYYRQSGEPRTGVVFHDGMRVSEVAPSR